MKYKYAIIIIIISVFIFSSCKPIIDSFEDCANAGNPIIETFPRQCQADGQLFIENISQNEMAFHECTDEEKQAEICTLQYDPVCGLKDNGIRCITAPCPSLNAITFGNGCIACSNSSNGYYNGECNNLEFVVCKETITGFDPVEYALNNDGICVDICPGNYDEYTTQIGISLCIEHYGIEEISRWQICSQSSSECECAKAYETTSGENILNASYRCVPKRYADRLLFRSGLDTLDENGEQSVAIA